MTLGPIMRVKTLAAIVVYAASIPLANIAIQHVGIVEFPGGPHVLPVAPGITAPSGVWLIGVALVARDALHRYAGARAALVAIGVGVVLSVLVAPSVALASGVAFGVGELADMAVYTPLRRRHLPAAVLASGIVGAAIDSALFLAIAFGSVDYWTGNTIGKIWMSAVAASLIWIYRNVVSDRFDPAFR